MYQLSKSHPNVIQENTLLLISYGLFYFDFVDACQNGYNRQIEMYITFCNYVLKDQIL